MRKTTWFAFWGPPGILVFGSIPGSLAVGSFQILWCRSTYAWVKTWRLSATPQFLERASFRYPFFLFSSLVRPEHNPAEVLFERSQRAAASPMSDRDENESGIIRRRGSPLSFHHPGVFFLLLFPLIFPLLFSPPRSGVFWQCRRADLPAVWRARFREAGCQTSGA